MFLVIGDLSFRLTKRAQNEILSPVIYSYHLLPVQEVAFLERVFCSLSQSQGLPS